MATPKGISKYSDKQIENGQIFQNTPEKSMHSILKDSRGNLWYATSEQGVSLRNTDGTVNLYNQTNGFVNDCVIDIKESKEGEVWFVTIMNGIYKYKEGEFIEVISTTDIKGDVLSITLKEDYLLVATNRGVFEYDGKLTPIPDFDSVFVKSVISRDDELWLLTANSLVQNKDHINKQFSENEGFSSKLPTVGFCDREGNLWFGTSGDGIYKFTNSAFIKFDSRHGLLNEDVLSIIKDNSGKYWYGTNGGGIYLYDSINMVNYTTKDGLSNNYITSSTKDKQGNVWFGTRGGGIVKYDGKKFQNYFDSGKLSHNNIRRIYCSTTGDIWIATINGLSKWDGDIFLNYSTEEGLLDHIIWNIFEQNGLVYFVTQKGINVFENGKLRSFYESVEVFNKRVNTIRFSLEGELLIGYSGHGFRKIDIDKKVNVWISSEDGLVSDIIHDIEQIGKNKFLITTERGIDLLTLDQEMLTSITHLANKNSGLGLAKTNSGAIFRDKEHVCIGAKNGVYCYTHRLDRKQKASPIVYISSIELLYGDRAIIHNQYPIYEFKCTQNSIGISYFGNCFNDAKNVVYQYKITDFQNEWSLPSRATSTIFTNLPAGDYTFQVRAKNSDGVISKQPAIFRFKITPPIWQRPWFYFLMILMIVVLVRYAYLYRLKANVLKVLELEKIREEEVTKVRKIMARDFHDNMGNQLASITVFSNLIGIKLKNKSIEIDDLLKNIEKHSKSLYNGTKDFIWSMNPESDNLNEIFTYIKDFGDDFFIRTDIDFYADAKIVDSSRISLPSGWSRQIVLIFKEAMTNSLKHSKASALYLILKLENNSFVISCSDNGRGVEENKIGNGNGYRNMHARASQIDCSLVIKNRINEQGLEVVLTGELPKKQETDGIKIF